MTTVTQTLWRKWLFYRNLLAAFFVLNVFCVASGFVLSFNYWGFKQSLRDKHQTELRKLAASADLERQVAGLESTLFAGAKADRASLLREAGEWHQLKAHLAASGLLEKYPLHEATIADPKSALAYLKDIKTGLAGERKAVYENLTAMVESYSDTTREIVVIGGFTLLFGLVLPGFVLWRLTRLLKSSTEQLRHTAREIVDEWLRQNDKYGAEPFKNPEFWVQLFLLTTQFSGRAMGHPMAQLAGEMAGLVRHELEKSRGPRAA